MLLMIFQFFACSEGKQGQLLKEVTDRWDRSFEGAIMLPKLKCGMRGWLFNKYLFGVSLRFLKMRVFNLKAICLILLRYADLHH